MGLRFYGPNGLDTVKLRGHEYWMLFLLPFYVIHCQYIINRWYHIQNYWTKHYRGLLWKGLYVVETVAENTVQVILFYHHSLNTAWPGNFNSVIFGLSVLSLSEESIMNAVFSPEVNPAFVGLKCTETLMTYQMTPKYEFNGFWSTGILCSSSLTCSEWSGNLCEDLEFSWLPVYSSGGSGTYLM